MKQDKKKICGLCQNAKPVTQFRNSPLGIDGRSNSCEKCYQSASKSGIKEQQGARCNTTDVAHSIFKQDRSKVPACYMDMLEREQRWQVKADLEITRMIV